MNNTQYSRLKPFLKGTSYKSKIFVYLLAEGVTPLALSKMSLGDCIEETQKHSVPNELELCFESLYSNHAGAKTELAFTYPNGRKYSVGDIENVLIRAYGIAGLDYGGVRSFVVFISKGSHS